MRAIGFQFKLMTFGCVLAAITQPYGTQNSFVPFGGMLAFRFSCPHRCALTLREIIVGKTFGTADVTTWKVIKDLLCSAYVKMEL